MSGGHFYYKQEHIRQIADDLESYIDRAAFSEETIDKLKIGLELLRLAFIYTQRIDWLLSFDDGEDSFHRRLKQELEQFYERKEN
jgi:hypothetical protein